MPIAIAIPMDASSIAFLRIALQPVFSPVLPRNAIKESKESRNFGTLALKPKSSIGSADASKSFSGAGMAINDFDTCEVVFNTTSMLIVLP